MFQGKMKAVTFSFDDGVTQDKRLIDIFNRYGLKCTFNLNSARLDEAKKQLYGGKVTISHVTPRPQEVAAIYQNHEVAAHTLHHPHLDTRSRDTIIREVNEDCEALSQLVGYEVVGFAYPGGDPFVDEDVVRVVREDTQVKYARKTTATGNFDLPEDLFQFYPSVHGCDFEKMMAMAEEFIALQPDRPKLFSVWGHAFEYDGISDGWRRMEEFCRLISGHEDIFYGTNTQCLLEE